MTGSTSSSAPSAPTVDLRARSAAVGAVVGLGTLGTMFAGLLFAYAYLRVSNPQAWSPEAGAWVALPRLLPMLTAVMAVGGTVAIWRWPRRVLALLVATTVVMVVLQGLTLREVVASGLGPGSGPRGSVVFGLTALHAFYLLSFAVLGTSRALIGAGRLRELRSPPHPAWAWTFHVLVVAWLLIYGSVYVF